MRKSKVHGAILHAIDATPARWRGDAGSSPLDGVITAEEDEPEDEPEDSEPDDSGSCASRGDDCDSDGDCCQKNGGATRSCFERRNNEAFGTCQTQCPDDAEYVCRSNYAPTPRPVAAPKSSGNYAPTYQPTENPDRRLAGAPTLRGSYSA